MRRSLYILACFFCTIFPYTAFSQKEAAAKTADSLLIYAANTYQQDLKSTLQATRDALQLAREHQLEEHICKPIFPRFRAINRKFWFFSLLLSDSS